jgi:hypothetical protein
MVLVAIYHILLVHAEQSLFIYLNQSNANCQCTAKNGRLGGKPGAEVLGASVEVNKLSNYKQFHTTYESAL